MAMLSPVWRIAALAGRARRGSEGAEAGEDHALIARQRLGNRREHGISTALWACAFDSAAWLATWTERSDFFMGVFLGTGGRQRLHGSAPGRVGASR